MRDEMRASRSCGSRAQSAVMPSRLSTARIGDRVLVGPLVAHHARRSAPAAAPRSFATGACTSLRVFTSSDDDRVRAAQQSQPRRRHLAENPHGEAGPGKRLADDELLVESELAADLPHFVLEQLAQRLDQLHAHPLGQAADVVVALDHRRLADDRNRLDDVGIERALRQEINLPELGRFLLEHVDERRADDLPLLLRIR